MSETRPITTPPRRRNHLLAHVQHVFNGSTTYSAESASTVSSSQQQQLSLSPPSQATSSSSMIVASSSNNSTMTIRRLEPFHRALLDSGCQSAKSSPLPHRRLDKLEGTIRDKPVTPNVSTMRRIMNDDSNLNSSCESSPIVMRKRLNSCSDNPLIGGNSGDHNNLHGHQRFINNHQESPMPYRKHHQQPHHNEMDFKNAFNKAFTFDSSINESTCCETDCQCNQNNKRFNKNSILSPQTIRKFGQLSPTKSTIAEPGCFNSPIHRQNAHTITAHCNHFIGNSTFGSPAKSIIGEPGIFASPARSVCSNNGGNGNRINVDDIDADEISMQQQHSDQAIVSGWLKFRDNKRVSNELLML